MLGDSRDDSSGYLGGENKTMRRRVRHEHQKRKKVIEDIGIHERKSQENNEKNRV